MSDHDKDTDDQLLSNLYHGIGDEQPSAELDRRILSEARKAVESGKGARHKGRGPFSGQWTVPVSLAAVVVLSVIVVITIQREQPETLSSLPQPQVSTSQSQLSADQHTAEIEAVQPIAPKTKSDQEGKPLPPAMSKARVKDKAPTAKMEKEAASGFSYDTKQQPEPIPRLRKPMPESVISESRQSEPARQSVESGALAGVQAKIERSTQSGVAVKDDTVASAGSSLQEEPPAEAAEESVPAKANSTFDSDAGKALKRKPAPMSFAAPSQPEMKTDCRHLSEGQCVQSTECILDKDMQSGEYRCRAADNDCEYGFTQYNAVRQQCEYNAGCVFVPANCYCAPEEKCECAGGLPAMCKPADKSGTD